MPLKISVTLPLPRWMFWRKRTITRPLPASWDEIPMPRRVEVLRLLLSKPGEAGKVAAVRHLLDLPKAVFLALDAEQVASICGALPWLEAKPNPMPITPFFGQGGTVYHFPTTHFLSGTCLEFALADEGYNAFMETGSTEGFRLLAGAICRESEPDKALALKRGDARVPLNSRAEAEARGGLLAMMPEHLKIAVLLYWSGVKEYVHRAYGKWLFEQDEEDGTEKPPTQKPNDPLLWFGLFMDVAENITKLDDVLRGNFHDLCLFLVRRRRAERDAKLRQRMASLDFGNPSTPNP